MTRDIRKINEEYMRDRKVTDIIILEMMNFGNFFWGKSKIVDIVVSQY